MNKPSRADLLRQRRDQKRTRVNLTASGAGVVRPLVSRPYRSDVALPRRSAWRLPRLWANDWRKALGGMWRSGRLFSLFLTLFMLAALMLALSDTRLYVTRIALYGANVVPAEEIYAESGVAQQHIFWVHPAAAEARLLRVPGLISATVQVTWPGQVRIDVGERIPSLVVHQPDGTTLWADTTGVLFPERPDWEHILPLVVEGEQALESVPPLVVAGALKLRELRPNIERLYYSPADGLSYQDGRGWRGYFGVGYDMPQRLFVYETLIDHLLNKGIQPQAISVQNPAAPFYRK